MTSSSALTFDYKFTPAEGEPRSFHIELDPVTLAIRHEEKENYPDWTALSYQKCSNCPLNEKDHPRCPVAQSLAEVMETFKDTLSFEEVDVEIKTQTRTYVRHAPVQNGLSSLVGIYMVTSGCPHLDKLRPLVRTHLPFASMEETAYRMLSMYLLAQYFISRKGGKPDWEIKELPRAFQDIQTVNRHFHKRISSMHTQDAGLNAVVRLDFFARFTNTLLVEEDLGEIEQFFSAYLQDLKKI